MLIFELSQGIHKCSFPSLGKRPCDCRSERGEENTERGFSLPTPDSDCIGVESDKTRRARQEHSPGHETKSSVIFLVERCHIAKCPQLPR